MALVNITQLSNGTTADALAVDNNFNAITAQVNGNLDSTNLAAGGVAASNLAAGLEVTQGGWLTTGETWTYGANNGNKEFTVTVPTDKTTKYSPGMKVRLARGTTPPTQSMSFTAASSQYATKASPTGITFTGAFTCEAWVYLNSYTGSQQVIVGRQNSAGTTGGWMLSLNGAGVIKFYYGATTNFTEFDSYQSVPLNTWVHIAGVVTSVASKTAILYMNAQPVPFQTAVSNSTTLTQPAEDIRLGAAGGTPAAYFDGYMSEVRVWSAAQSQAQIQANMAINCVGNEANLVALFQGGGNFNDATTNANNLTATNGAIATQASNPYNALEYGVITKATYSNPNTTLTIFTGDVSNIPNQTLTSPSYSLVKAPFGFPTSRAKWRVQTMLRSDTLMGTLASTWYGSPTVGTAAIRLFLPTGDWEAGYIANTYQDGGNSQSPEMYVTLSTSQSAPNDNIWTSYVRTGTITNATSGPFFVNNHVRTGFLTTTALTPYSLLMQFTGCTGNARFSIASNSVTIIYGVCAYI